MEVEVEEGDDEDWEELAIELGLEGIEVDGELGEGGKLARGRLLRSSVGVHYNRVDIACVVGLGLQVLLVHA